MNEKIYEVILNPATVACLFGGGLLIGAGLARIVVGLARELEHIRKSQIQEDE